MEKKFRYLLFGVAQFTMTSHQCVVLHFVIFFLGLVSKNINRWFDFIDETQLYIVANSDLTMDHPKPLFPNVISIEGLTSDDAKPLSEGK